MEKNENKKFIRSIRASEMVNWKVDDLLPDDYQIDFSQSFLPSSLTGDKKLTFLNPEERLCLNQIWGASYFNIFAFVEEYITIFTLNLANEIGFDENHKLRSYVRFSEEEVKHQILFRKYIDKFQNSFRKPCLFLEGEKEVASLILSNTKLCVALLTYHLELVTQQHYQDSIQTEESINPKIKEILKCHWLEEAQHAQLDLVKLQQEFTKGSEDNFISATNEYLYLIDAIIGLLGEQVKLNLESLRNCFDGNIGVRSESEISCYFSEQTWAYVKVFVIQGMKNPTFLNEVGKLSRKAVDLILNKAQEIENKLTPLAKAS